MLLRQFLGLESFHICGRNRNRNPHVPWSGAIPVAQLHLYPLRHHPVGFLNMDMVARAWQVVIVLTSSTMKAFATSMPFPISPSPAASKMGRLVNLLCKFEKREALERAGHQAERMSVI